MILILKVYTIVSSLLLIGAVKPAEMAVTWQWCHIAIEELWEAVFLWVHLDSWSTASQSVEISQAPACRQSSLRWKLGGGAVLHQCWVSCETFAGSRRSYGAVSCSQTTADWEHSVCAVLNYRVFELVRVLEWLVVTICNYWINPVTNPNLSVVI